MSKCGSSLIKLLLGLVFLTNMPSSLRSELHDKGVRLEVQSHISKYKVSGESNPQIIEALRESGPRDSKLISRDAYTYWHLSWKWGTKEDKITELNKVFILLTVKILIPHLDTKQKLLMQKWQTFQRPLIRHEMRHHSFAVVGAQLLKDRLAQEYAQKSMLAVARADEIAEEVLWQIRAKDEEYDLKTNHGESEGVRWNIGRVGS